jgi:hypothetical protein
LTDAQIAAAVLYNTARFKDPYTVMIIRDALGIPKYPAVPDSDLAQAAARYQADFGLTVDGKIGAQTTQMLVRELNAEDQRRMAVQLRRDNLVTWSTVTGPTRTGCGDFEWDVNFATTLRGGWLIQRIDNTWHATDCASGADVTPAFSAQYWEAWWVDSSGTVSLPTSTTTPPSTAATAGANDLWHNPPIAGSRGTWSQAGTVYTTLALPAGFAVHGPNSASEAGDLPSTRGPVSSDALGLAEGWRGVGGKWDCCDPDPAKHTHVPS